MRIIGIEGLWRKERNPVWVNLEDAFRREFAPKEFVIEEQKYLRLNEDKRMRALEDRIVAKYDDGEQMLLVGHSFGGIIACRVADRFARSRVLGIITIFSPHRLPRRFVGPKQEREPKAPIVSFGGWRDYIVPFFLTEHPRAVKHILLPIDHWPHIVADIRYAERIASEAKKLLFSST